MGKPPATVAVIDIGSNSGRVVVYRYQAGGHLHSASFATWTRAIA